MTELNIDMGDEAESAPAPQRGRPRGGGRSASREPNRDPSRGGVVVAKGRDGEVLSRKRSGVGDIFDIPKELIEPGWTMQWNAITVVGNAEVLMDQTMMMAENGWRPVPADRPGFAGRFVPVGSKGAIIRGGQRLEERPESLTIDARREETNKARQQISDRNESLKLAGVTKGTAFAMGDKYRGSGGNVKMNIDPGVYADESGNIVEAPRPQHTLIGSGE